MKITELFDQYITALEEDRMELLDGILAENVVVTSSHLGILYGLKAVKEAFRWQGVPLDVRKLRVFNNVIRKSGNEARQSVYLLLLCGKETDGFMHHFQCGFFNTIHYQKGKDGWKISDLNCNMAYETGNTLLVSGWWKLIDYGIYNGCRIETINKYENSPWLLIPQTDEVLSDEEQIKQCFWHYNWYIDTTDFNGLLSLVTENCYDTQLQTSKQEWVNWLMSKRPKEVCWSHISHFEEIQVDGDTATATIYRYEPNRIGTRFLHKYNLYTVYYSGIWNIGFVKRDGQWKMDTFRFRSAITEVPDQKEQRYF